jgi:hypothetical protein
MDVISVNNDIDHAIVIKEYDIFRNRDGVVSQED